MKKLPRKSIAITCLLIIAGLVVSSACGQAMSPNSTRAVGAGNASITFADLRLDKWNDYQKLADDFHQQNPTITVSIVPVDHSAPSPDADIARLADVVFLPGSNPATLPGMLLLQPLLDTTNHFNIDDLWPGSMTACSDAQGKSYGIPLTLFLQGIYYNLSLFDQAHIAYPQPGWTWDQFRVLISQLGSAANEQVIYGFLDGPYGNILDPLLAQQLSANGSHVDPQAMAAGLAWYLQLAKDKKLYPLQPAVNGVYQLEGMKQLLNNDQTAMWLSTTDIRQGVYLPYPVDQPTDHTTPVYANCGAISAGTKNPQAAWAWLEFLSQQDLTGSADSGMLPGSQSLTSASPFYASLTDQEKNALQYGLAHAWYYPPELGDTLFPLEQAVADATQSGTDLVGALQEAASSAQAQVQATTTAQPVALNTPLAALTQLPENGVAITFTAPVYFQGSMDVDGDLQALKKEFKKSHPEINIIFQNDYPNPVDGDYFRALAKSSDCFEYFAPYASSPWPQISPGDIFDLTPLLDADPTLRDDFFPAFFTPFTTNGKLYGLPADVAVEYIAYNADLLTSLGIPLPQSGWTLDDMLSIASQAAKLSANPSVYGFWDDNFNLLYAQHIPYLDTSVQPPRATFTSEAVIKAFTWFQPLLRNGTINLINHAHEDVYDQAISQGQAALWTTNGFHNYNFDPNTANSQPIYEKDFPFKVGFVPFPILASGEPMSMAYQAVGYYISGYSTPAKAHACWSWIQYLSDHPTIFGGYSPRKSLLPQESVGQNTEQFEVVQEAIQQYKSDDFENLADPTFAGYRVEEVGALVEISTGGDVNTALAEAQWLADAYRDCIAQQDLTGLNYYQVKFLANNCNLLVQGYPTFEPP